MLPFYTFVDAVRVVGFFMIAQGKNIVFHLFSKTSIAAVSGDFLRPKGIRLSHERELRTTVPSRHEVISSYLAQGGAHLC